MSSPARRCLSHSTPSAPSASPSPPGAPPRRGGSRRRAAEFCQLAQFVAEVLAGHRAPTHLRPCLAHRAYLLLVRRAGTYGCAQRPRVRSTRLSFPAPGVAEISSVVDCGRRHRALALRVDSTEHVWLCTHIETDTGP
ncbi:Rv3235 family protein [Salinactinospora qingdaonensis]|uniref:Uncharacterized protein n=1 Tax=Salinactinospora qingdaonensis TaxID=702744 RepID=A0ABP7FI20_9ACTN